MMLQLLITISSTFPILVVNFIFREDPKEIRCYELELENCFREAFLSAIHPPLIIKRDVAMFANGNVTVLDKRKRDHHHNHYTHMQQMEDPKTFQICHDVRKFSACFMYPACTEQLAASIASTQYHMVFGKKLPKHVFLAYRGYGTQECEKACSLTTCEIRNPLESKEEEALVMEMSTLKSHIDPVHKNDLTSACTRFKIVLVNLLRIRRQHCGEVAKCTCNEPIIRHNIDGCATGCEHFLKMDLDALSESYSSTSLPFPPFFLICFIFLRLLM